MSEEMIRDIFVSNLNKFLEVRGKTQLDLAKYLNVSATTINNWTKGYNLPRMDKVDDICKFFNINRSQLLGTSEKESTYYFDEETAEAAQEIYDNPNLRILFDASRKASPESLKAAAALIELMEKEENGEDY